MYECTNCHGCGCKFCGGIGYVIQDRPVVEMAPPTFEEFYSDEIKAAGFIKLADDEVVVKRKTAEHAARLSECYHCADPDCPCGECEADLEAALSREVKP